MAFSSWESAGAIGASSTFLFSIFISLVQIRVRGLRITRTPMTFTPFSNEVLADTLVVDCTHPTADQLTHHLKLQGQKNKMDLSLRGDSSTDAVMNAIDANHVVLQHKFVSSNHWDIDSFLSVWCCINREKAQSCQQLIRECARIGDFRELRLDETWQHEALKLACWLNSEERRLFYKPFESTISRMSGEEDGDSKFEYFLTNFNHALDNLNTIEIESQWKDEYARVVQEYSDLHSKQISNVKLYPSIGLAIVNYPQPMHYYSLFSVSRGFDIILSCYSNNRYELELKYTTYVDIGSRPCLPRVELIALVIYLNKRELSLKQTSDPTVSLDSSATTSTRWGANRITDSGPILRLDREDYRLNKAERYGHPYERPIYSSLITPDEMMSIVVAYFNFAYRKEGSVIVPKRDWEWTELHEFNRNLDIVNFMKP
eukprot:gene10657-22246_t